MAWTHRRIQRDRGAKTLVAPTSHKIRAYHSSETGRTKTSSGMCDLLFIARLTLPIYVQEIYSKTAMLVGSRNAAIEGILRLIIEQSLVQTMLNNLVRWWLTPCYLAKLLQSALGFWDRTVPLEVSNPPENPVVEFETAEDPAVEFEAAEVPTPASTSQRITRSRPRANKKKPAGRKPQRSAIKLRTPTPAVSSIVSPNMYAYLAKSEASAASVGPPPRARGGIFLISSILEQPHFAHKDEVRRSRCSKSLPLHLQGTCECQRTHLRHLQTHCVGRNLQHHHQRGVQVARPVCKFGLDIQAGYRENGAGQACREEGGGEREAGGEEEGEGEGEGEVEGEAEGAELTRPR